MVIKKKEITETDTDTAVFDDDVDITGGQNFDYDNPLKIEDPDPSMHYYFAAKDGDKGRPDGVARVMQKGYRVSSKKHYSTDCELMECPKDMYDRRMAIERKRNADIEKAAMEPANGLEKIREDHGIERKG